MHVLHTTLIRNCLRLGQIVKSEICSLFAAADSCVVRTQTITGGRRLQGWGMGQMGLALRASCVFCSLYILTEYFLSISQLPPGPPGPPWSCFLTIIPVARFGHNSGGC
jgi:hypothetical protein